MRTVVWHTNEYDEPVDRHFSFVVSYHEAVLQSHVLESKYFLKLIFEYNDHISQTVWIEDSDMVIILDMN